MPGLQRRPGAIDDKRGSVLDRLPVVNVDAVNGFAIAVRQLADVAVSVHVRLPPEKIQAVFGCMSRSRKNCE